VTGIGLGILWIGYTAFAYGHALIRGSNVTFSDMVLPSHRVYALGQLATPSGFAGGGASGPLEKILSAAQAVAAAPKNVFGIGAPAKKPVSPGQVTPGNIGQGVQVPGSPSLGNRQF